MNTEKQIIESIAEELPFYGPYELARRIVSQSFKVDEYNNRAASVYRTFYSVLSVIRRFRAKQAA